MLPTTYSASIKLYLCEENGVTSILQEDFYKIDKFYTELGSDQSHYENSNDICTPLGCVKEMVDTVPDELWGRENCKILDSCCGNGNFHAYIQKKTRADNLYFNEINEKRINNVKKIFGEDINLTKRDFLTFDDKEEFDLVVSNPPYAKFKGGKRVSKNHNMSRDFILKALSITKTGGYILFICPNNWMSFSDRNKLPKLLSQHQFLHLNISEAKKWFPKIGSSFTWFLLKKTPNSKAFIVENHFKRTDKVSVSLDKGASFIPLYYNDAVRSLVKKTIYASGEKHRVETTSDLHHYTKQHLMRNTEDAIYIYPLIHTFRQTVWSRRPHKYQNGWKVFMSLSGYYETRVDNCGMTQSVAFVRCKSKEEAEKLKQELDQPLYRAINNLTRYGNFNNIRVLQALPRLKDISLNEAEREIVDFFGGVI